MAALALGASLLGACGSIPADSEGTYDRARGATLVVGVSEHHPWAVVDDGTGEVTGVEADVVRGFADSIGADVEWKVGPESVLADWVDKGEADVMIGGLTASSPWSDTVALTRPYTTVESAAGEKEKMVMAVPMGENKLLVALERYLAREAGEI
ncbi:transporter substrate-binding domain-containing protein [Corynebacterium auris]|uniref:transporter substrate-binding domain-containing protein n=1 Tax=Corynebacterium auris TaxID=44750 RepID=UPI0025B2BF74|nr:transporter substrate-binding domain-containing protein [Corynebacterium auris]WJY67016.1 Bacterial extracellular solute-binding protein, family 3 [Corynebacterium auris]